MMELGVTILFVSHDTHSIKTLCTRAVWIENGKVKEYGDAGKVANKYIESQHLKINENSSSENYNKLDTTNSEIFDNEEIPVVVGIIKRELDLNISQRYGDGRATILDAVVLNQEYKQVQEIIAKKDYFVQISILFNSDLPTFVVGVMISSIDGIQQLGCLNSQDQVEFPAVKKGQIYIVTIKLNCPLKAGIYSLTLACEYPVINNLSHNFLDVINNFLPIKIVYEDNANTFYSMFYTKGEYFIERINNNE